MAASDTGRRSPVVKAILLVIGMLSLGLGLLAIFVPLLPTTPFLLLAAACFARGSERVYAWMIGNRVFGSYLKSYREGNGLPARGKVISTALLWGAMLVSIFVFIDAVWIEVALIVVAMVVSAHILTLKTYRPSAETD